MNQTVEAAIAKLKLESMEAYSIFEWLEKNQNKNKYSIIDNREVVRKLYHKNDTLVNVGLAMYSKGYTYEMYKNANTQEEKLAYLSSEVNKFIIEAKDIINELIVEYQQHKLNKDKIGIQQTEDKLKAFFSNEHIYKFRCILCDLYCKKCFPKIKYKEYGSNIFKNIDNELWLKLISYTSNQHILSKYDETIDDRFAPDNCDEYLDMFWELFLSVEVTEENATMLVDMIDKHEAISTESYFTATLKNVNRWGTNERNSSFLFARLYLARTNEDLLSGESKDLAIRLAYYSSQKFVQELNKNLPDKSKLDKMYGYHENYDYYMEKLEGYYLKDKADFLGFLIENDYALSDNLLLRHAVSAICHKDSDYIFNFNDRANEIDNKYPNLFKNHDELTELDKLKNQEEANQFMLEKIQAIDSTASLTLQKLSSLPVQIKNYGYGIQVLLVIIIILEIINLFF